MTQIVHYLASHGYRNARLRIQNYTLSSKPLKPGHQVTHQRATGRRLADNSLSLDSVPVGSPRPFKRFRLPCSPAEGCIANTPTVFTSYSGTSYVQAWSQAICTGTVQAQIPLSVPLLESCERGTQHADNWHTLHCCTFKRRHKVFPNCSETKDNLTPCRMRTFDGIIASASTYGIWKL